MFAEVDQLRIEFWIVPVGRFDGSLGIIRDDSLRHATKRPKCVLQCSNEALGILLENGFCVTRSRMTVEHEAFMDELEAEDGQ